MLLLLLHGISQRLFLPLSIFALSSSLCHFFCFTFSLYLYESVFPSVPLSTSDSLALYFNLRLSAFPLSFSVSIAKSFFYSAPFIPFYRSLPPPIFQTPPASLFWGFTFLPLSFLKSLILYISLSVAPLLSQTAPISESLGCKSSPAFFVYHNFVSVYNLTDLESTSPHADTHPKTHRLLRKSSFHAYVAELALFARGSFHLNKCIVYGLISKMLPAQLITAEWGGKLP